MSYNLSLNPHSRIGLLTLKTEEGRETKRNISWLPPIRTPTRDQTQNLGVRPDWGSTLILFVHGPLLQ